MRLRKLTQRTERAFVSQKDANDSKELVVKAKNGEVFELRFENKRVDDVVMTLLVDGRRPWAKARPDPTGSVFYLEARKRERCAWLAARGRRTKVIKTESDSSKVSIHGHRSKRGGENASSTATCAA